MTRDEIKSMEFQCPACNAGPGERCTQPTDNARKPVSWVHYARLNELMKDYYAVVDDDELMKKGEK